MSVPNVKPLGKKKGFTRRKLSLEDAEEASVALALSCLDMEPFKFLLAEVPAVDRLFVLSQLVMQPQLISLISSSQATGLFVHGKLIAVHGVSPSTSFPFAVGLKVMALLRKNKHKRAVSKMLRYYNCWFKMVRSLSKEASQVKIFFGSTLKKEYQDAILIPECNLADSEKSYLASVVSDETFVRQLRDYGFTSVTQFDTPCSICPIVRSLPPLYLCVRSPNSSKDQSINHASISNLSDDSLSMSDSSSWSLAEADEEDDNEKLSCLI